MSIIATAEITGELNDLHKINELASERITKRTQHVLPLCSACYIACISSAYDVAFKKI